jgi:hypothetical protein
MALLAQVGRNREQYARQQDGTRGRMVAQLRQVWFFHQNTRGQTHCRT